MLTILVLIIHGVLVMNMINIKSWQSSSAQPDERPFDIGYDAGLTQQTIFDCPYGHLTEQCLRQRHEWLEGFLTALASIEYPSFY